MSDVTAWTINKAMTDLEEAKRSFERAHPEMRYAEGERLERAFTAYAKLLAQAAVSAP